MVKNNTIGNAFSVQFINVHLVCILPLLQIQQKHEHALLIIVVHKFYEKSFRQKNSSTIFMDLL